MGTHRAAHYLVIALSNVLLVVGAPASSGTTNNFNFGQEDGVLVGGSSFYISSTIINNGKNKCSHTVNVIGQGVDDSFPLSCGTNNGVTSISGEAYALYENPRDDFTFFTDTPSTLVVIKKDECTKRSYKTSQGKTSYSEESMSTNQCNMVKEKTEAKKEENRKYWEQWQKDYVEQLKKVFPMYQGVSLEDNIDDDITETDKTSPEYWRQWQMKFDERLRKLVLQNGDEKKKPLKDKKSGSQPSDEEVDDSDIENWNF